MARRAAFLVLGIPGLIVALVVRFTVSEPQRGQLDDLTEKLPSATLRDTLSQVAAHKSAFHLLMGGSVATLWSWGLMWWMPTFLVRSHHMTVSQAGDVLGPMHLIAGTAGTLLASWLMSRPAAANPRYITHLLAWVTAMTTIPSMLLFVVHSEWLTRLLLWIFVPSVYFYIGPILGLLQNAVPPRMRATTCALLLFAANVANLVIAPQLIGWLSDWFASRHGHVIGCPGQTDPTRRTTKRGQSGALTIGEVGDVDPCSHLHSRPLEYLRESVASGNQAVSMCGAQSEKPRAVGETPLSVVRAVIPFPLRSESSAVELVRAL